ncbi:hypothetical protein ACVGWN_22765, partial [Enterobacter hormaechei]
PGFSPKTRQPPSSVVCGGVVYFYKKQIQYEPMRHECLPHAISLVKALIDFADRIDTAEELVARVRQYS